jgi:hypothetical protein
MSAYEGSAMQEADERRRAEREREVERVKCENPSLTWEQARAWVIEQERRRQPPPKCCPCQSADRAELVASGNVIGRCTCGCHGARTR